jgi:hypothetical protein
MIVSDQGTEFTSASPAPATENQCTKIRPSLTLRESRLFKSGGNRFSEQYKAGKRFTELFDQGLIPVVLHLADHDPNGIDMSRDNAARLELYARCARCAGSRSTSTRCAAITRRRTSQGNRQPICGLCRAAWRGMLGVGRTKPHRDRRSDP